MPAQEQVFAAHCDMPLSVNPLLFLDSIGADAGPTRVGPHSHRGEGGLEPEQARLHPKKVTAYAEPGDAAFISSALWHTGGRNEGDGLRRGIYLYYGYWWLKRCEADQALPWQGFRNPGGLDLHPYRVTETP